MSKNGDKKVLILKSAIEVFSELGYHSASVAKIAKQARIGEGTVYLYFKNKEDILITLFENTVRDDFLAKLEKKLSYFTDSTFQLYEITREHFDYFSRDKQLSRVIQVELRQTSPTFEEALKPVIRKNYHLIENVIAKGQETGVFRRDIPKWIARMLVFGTLDEMVSSWVRSSRDYSLIEMVEPAYKLFYQSLIELSTEEGKKINNLSEGRNSNEYEI